MLLTLDKNLPKESDVIDPKTDPDKFRLRNANLLAYSMLTLACTDEVTLQVVDSARPQDFPNGRAYDAWKALENIHKPQSQANKYELQQKLKECDLKQDTKNPDEWFAEIERLKTQLKNDFSYTITDDDIISHIVFNLKPKFYQNLLTVIKRELNNGTVPKLEDLKKDIRQVYVQQTQEGQKRDKEMILTASVGHQNSKLRSPTKPKFTKQYKNDCRICGKKGHKGSDCWENPDNKDKRPSFINQIIIKVLQEPLEQIGSILIKVIHIIIIRIKR